VVGFAVEFTPVKEDCVWVGGSAVYGAGVVLSVDE